MFQLDEINQLFLPHMRTKLMWFYQEVEEEDSNSQFEMVTYVYYLFIIDDFN